MRFCIDRLDVSDEDAILCTPCLPSCHGLVEWLGEVEAAPDAGVFLCIRCPITEVALHDLPPKRPGVLDEMVDIGPNLAKSEILAKEVLCRVFGVGACSGYVFMLC